MCMQHGRITSPLKASGRSDTLAGGTEGSNQAPKEQPSLFPEQDHRAEVAKRAHASLSKMIGGYLQGKRPQLDRGFDDLVECLEEMRDAVPKA